LLLGKKLLSVLEYSQTAVEIPILQVEEEELSYPYLQALAHFHPLLSTRQSLLLVEEGE
jgi:hypothetical protein